MTPELVTTTLTCGHQPIYSPPPRTGDVVFCARCDDYRAVNEGAPRLWAQPMYKATCADCKWTRKFNGLKNLRTWATTHAIRHRHHVNIANRNGDSVTEINGETVTIL